MKPDDNRELSNKPGFPTVHFGSIGSGKPIVHNDQTRLEFASKYHCVGLDSEFDQVCELPVESWTVSNPWIFDHLFFNYGYSENNW